MAHRPSSEAGPQSTNAEGIQIFPPTVDGITEWATTAGPRPPRAIVVEHVEWLRSRDLIPQREVEQLWETFPELREAIEKGA